ncbi:serine-rich adhesin for platelets-like isoform X2 [Maniola hyperantus]|uniref:serine-rich adhesin for platelets-like isoform X2 n=1 Tax=Aphantopus hyperantus TaxID=2795564 RepID=UPI003748EE17
MPGGRLVVLDRLGRDVKAYPLAEGLATIGSDAACDIRILLPTVSPHHATVVVHSNQTVVSSINAGETLVNGVAVSVCVLRHGDLLGVGGRTLRWEYDQPYGPSARATSPVSPGASLARSCVRGRRRKSPQATPHRANMSTSASGKQVAIVQPQRRDTTNDHNESPQTSASAGSRSRSSRNADAEAAADDVDTTHRKSTARASPKNVSLNDTTKASLWIESRKTPRALPRALPRSVPRSTARKSTPLRLAVLRKAQSAHKMRVTKIQAPAKIDHTKQAAIMLMTGHTPKPKQPTPKQRPSFVVKKPSPVRGKSRGSPLGVTPKRFSTRVAVRDSEGGSGDQSISILQSPMLLKPRKSAMKKTSKKSTRKTESIKFDLSNLENPEDRPSDVVLLEDVTKDSEYDITTEEDILLHYSDTSRSPSPRRSIHSRSSRILERSLGETYVQNVSSDRSVNPDSPRSKKSPNRSVSESPRQRKSSRGSLIVEKALENSFDSSVSPNSRRTTKSLTDQSYITTIASTRKTMTRSPRSNKRNLESYSIVDLVSMDSIGSDGSVYGSAGSETSTAPFATPIPGRSTRANDSKVLSSSTPYADKTQQGSKTVSLRSTSSPQVSVKSRKSTLSQRRSASLTTPENTQTRISVNSTRISRASRSRSRINDSDLLLMDDDDASPRSSKRINKTSLASPVLRKTIAITDTPESVNDGNNTPENRYSPEEATTPVLSIQNLIEQSFFSQSSSSSQKSPTHRGASKRKRIGGDRTETKKPRSSLKSTSLIATSRRSLRTTTSSVDHMDLSRASNDSSQDEEVTTPKSGIIPIQEGVKNKHSTAKKTQSKRSIIDNLDESDLVKQLFNSPVKRKLSQSMTEFSRKKLFEDDGDVRRPTRNTIAFTGRSPDNSFMGRTENFTTDVFISPLSTPGKSPNVTGQKRVFDNTPENDVKSVLRTSCTTRSIRNDLTDVAEDQQVSPRSPRNRISDVREKEVFAPSPKNDLRNVSGVKTLFRSTRKRKSPKNTLEDVRGVKELFRNKKSVSNDLRKVSGVKSALRVNSPRNDLTDVRGLRRLYTENDPKNELSDVSGVEELFYEDSQDSLFDVVDTHENQDLNATFDQLIGKPPVLRAYTKPRSFTKVVKPKRKRKAKSLNNSISTITENVEEWLQNEFKKCVKEKSTNKSNLTRALQKLSTDTVEGNTPIQLSRSRNNTSKNAGNQERKKSASEIYSTHTLPIKKRSLVKANRSSHVERLPIKKRRVLHSTPVKGKFSMTMNASELGRVSPIVKLTAVDKMDGLLQTDVSATTKISLTDDQKLGRLSTKVISPDIAQKNRSPKKPSPKQTRASRSTASSKRASLVIRKKKPILSPKLNKDTPKPQSNDKSIEVPQKTTRPVRQIQVNDKLKTPKNTRAKKTIVNETESQDLQSEAKKKVEKTTKRKSLSKETPKTLRSTRARANKSTVVVTKPSPHSKPKRNTSSKVNEPTVTRTRQRKQNIEVPDLTIEQKQSRRARNAKNVTEPKPTIEKPKAKTQEIPQDVTSKPNRRGQNVTFEAKPNIITTKRVASKSVNKEVAITSPRVRRNQKDVVVATPKTRRGRSKMTIIEENLALSIDELRTKAKRGVKSKSVTFKDDLSPNKKRKIVQIEKEGIKVTRGRKIAEDTVKTGKKTADSMKSDKANVEQKPKRGQKNVVEKTEIETNTTARRSTRKVQSENTIEGIKSVLEDKKKSPIGRRTRNTQKSSKSDEIVKEVTKNIPEDKKETAVGKRTRNLQKSNAKGKEDVKEVSEDQLEVASSRGRRNKNVTEKEAQLEDTKGKKTTSPVKVVPKRGGRTKKAEPTKKEVQSEEISKAARRKRKVDIDETTNKEAPAKRLRVTRAAATLGT